MSKDPPYSMGIFETIVNCHFGGLAVEFLETPGKSLLELSDGIPDFNRFIISVWVRLPGNSVARKAVESTAAGPLSHIIPVVVFGKQYDTYRVVEDIGSSTPQIRTDYSRGDDCVVSGTPHSQSVYDGPVLSTAADATSVSYIGFNTFLDGRGVPTATLSMRFQVNTIGSGEWVYTRPFFTESDYGTLHFDLCPGGDTETAWDPGIAPRGACVTEGIIPGTEHQRLFGQADETALYTQNTVTDVFESSTDEIKVSPNHWHHLLISGDLSKPSVGEGEYDLQVYPADCSGGYTPERDNNVIRKVTNPCKLWVAFDDINQTGSKINDEEDRQITGLGANGIAPINVLDAASRSYSTSTERRVWGDQGELIVDTFTEGNVPTFAYSPGVVSTQGFPLGIPVVSALAGSMVDIEMAEFQMWTGKTLNTGVKAARRLFVSDAGKPVPPTTAEKALGKPVLRLHTTRKWQNGDNTGSPPIQLTRTNAIIPYHPDPSLRSKNQGKPQ